MAMEESMDYINLDVANKIALDIANLEEETINVDSYP